MPLDTPYPELDEIIAVIGEAGRRLSDIGASEGAAGNISVFLGWPVEPRRRFSNAGSVELPLPVPALAGGALLVTGSGRRLREVSQDPAANLGFVAVGPDGRSGTLCTAPRRLFDRLTSELNAHLAVHQDQVAATGTNFHAVVHAQPLYLTYLSHVPRYQSGDVLSRRLLRWQPEAVVNLPEGIGCLPFLVPGSNELAAASADSLRSHRIAVWGKHGVIARSDRSVKRAVDRIEYAETAARYECLNLANGEAGQGLSDEELRALCRAFDVNQRLF
ncbi:MAG: class II aldolase/adducin family protein [Candidatus Aminicenantes bacterium]|nr:class II aldolase/adducin family protein [Candidatus Aminicenantes bacterium]